MAARSNCTRLGTLPFSAASVTMATAGSRSLTAGKRGPEPGYRLGLRAAQGESLRPPAPASLPVGDPKPAAKSASSFPRRPRDRKCLGPGRGRTRVASSAPSLESAPVPALLPRPSPWQLLAFGAWAASQVGGEPVGSTRQPMRSDDGDGRPQGPEGGERSAESAGRRLPFPLRGFWVVVDGSCRRPGSRAPLLRASSPCRAWAAAGGSSGPRCSEAPWHGAPGLGHLDLEKPRALVTLRADVQYGPC